MSSTVKIRPNLYEVLGLGPSADADEIARAFARQLSEPRAFGSLTDVTMAYETLRDPARRKAYDSSIGLRLKPTPAFSLTGRVEGAQLRDAKSASLVDRLETPRAMRASPVPRPESRPQRPAPSATALLRRPIAPHKPEEILRPTPAERPRPEPETSDALTRIADDPVAHSRHAPINWTLPAVAAGALVLAVGVGAWTGWQAGNDNESVTVKVPTAKVAAANTPAPIVASTVAEAPPRDLSRGSGPAARTVRARRPLQISLPEKQQAEVAVLEQNQQELETEAAVQAPAAAQADSMPLSKAVVARTIERIGYPCGEVMSTTAAGSGVYNVTCTSGHSYRASPVHGRYHFRRLAIR